MAKRDSQDIGDEGTGGGRLKGTLIALALEMTAYFPAV